MIYTDILSFWFSEIDAAQWFSSDPAFDEEVRERFGAEHERACRGELSAWRQTPKGRLAEIIVLDQFSRNIHRDTARAFAQDLAALILAQEAVATGADAVMVSVEKSFLYMPFMHSESRKIHERAEALYRQAGLEYNLDFERRHKAIIDRFGRYPHRNEILGRESTEEELAFLEQPGSGF